MASSLEHLAQLHMQTLNGVGGVNDFSDLKRISKERGDLVPYPSPALDNGRQFFAPFTIGKLLQPFGRQLGGLGVINALQFPSYRLTLFPVAERQRVANQMHDTGLKLGLRENGPDCFRKTF